MSWVKIVDSWLVDVNVSGYVSNFVVNGVAVVVMTRRPPMRTELCCDGVIVGSRSNAYNRPSPAWPSRGTGLIRGDRRL
jgi:hypothetical protein